MTTAVRRGASATALHELHEGLGSSGTLADAAERGEQLFDVAALLRAEPSLRRVLTDTTVEADAKAGLATSVLKGKVRDDTAALVADAARYRWTASSDLPAALEHLAVVSVVRSAGARTHAVSDQLFEVGQLLTANPSLRAAVSDLTRSGADRTALLAGLLDGKVHDATISLATHAVSGESRVDVALSEYQQIAAEEQQARVAVVHTARALGDSERDRLEKALARAYGGSVLIQVVVEPGLVGGLRVEIGDDVIDGTVANRLDEARRRLAG